ncbi:DciA family protein [Streptomyces sp. NPDC050529]|uniref:DciA family protein n=1 Tax=Streptomyces sp. NPDC050529 TaxID=3365624 RepID=UPI0037972FD2
MPDTTPQQPAASGQDLARLALAQYKASTKANPQQPRQTARRSLRGVRTGDRRDPSGLGNVLTQLAGDLGWQQGVQGGNILDRWAELCPQYVDRIEPVHYDAERRVLELRPCSPAYAAQLRLLGGQLAKQINDKVGSEVVRAIKPLPVGAMTAESSSQPAPVTAPAAPAAPAAAPVTTRGTASPGYQAALAAVRPKAATAVDALVAAAIDRQVRASAREPETVHANAIDALAALHAGQELSRSEEVQQAALQRKHGGDRPVRTAFDIA